MARTVRLRADQPLALDDLVQRIHVDDRSGIRRQHGRGDPRARNPARRVPGAAGRRSDPLDPPPSAGSSSTAQAGRSAAAARAIDITARKQAEQETLRLRQDIAHVGRVSVMGQLASALAHEINQPLGAILRNAEAAALFLQDPSPDLDEISAILEDIRKDDQRAGAVIDRMRALLRRQRDRDDAARRGADARRRRGAAAPGRRGPPRQARDRHRRRDLPPVAGDRVQLQQVLLNLILNGMDALDGGPGEPAQVAVTRAAPRHACARDQRQRHRQRHSGRATSSASSTRSSRTKTKRHRHGPVDLAQHRRGARRPSLGGEQRRRRGELPLQRRSIAAPL